MKFSVVILAAGVGSRMKSPKPKVLHRICGKSMIVRITEAALQVSDDVHIVLYHQKEVIEAHLCEYFGDKLESISLHTQDCQNFPGTGGALMDSSGKLIDLAHDRLVVLNGDMPLISPESIAAIAHTQAPIVVSTITLENPSGYGRVLVDPSGQITQIIEEKDCNQAQKAINLVNAGIYGFDRELLERSLPRLSNDNAQREYYLTDIIALARSGDSALRDKSLIASHARRLHTPSMRPCARSQSKDFSSQILESCPEMDKQTSAIPKILEEDKQAGRKKSCREQLQLESTFDTATLHEPAKDSRSFAQNAQNVATPQAEGFEMRNCGFQGGGEGILLGVNEQAPAAESTICRSKPTPNTLIAPFYGNAREFMGVNSKSELAQAEAIRLQELRRRAMDQGVIMRLPESIYLEEWVEFEGECEIENNVRICGRSTIKHSHIKAGSVVEDSVIAHSDIGPMAHIRPKSHISHTHIGNFVETKSAHLEGVKAGHLSYLGDCEIGSGSNVGAGVITCNYDGKSKHKTHVGEHVFIGSDSQLIAPCNIESHSIIAAGSTITDKVASGELAISRVKQKNIAGFFFRFFGKSRD
ncbi:NTP transferase domain-containing protein [uncultured Helicobacter sp.]|uniref:NTP transferase domain-containing protein n=1 Tax=uncultured Helicobacter sp. TaxID=175537 RepID=UPI00260CCFEF|nr:NTP transferase domain-containing protein [uncultured Helicobacter sp.]